MTKQTNKKTTLIVARHGAVFLPGMISLRIGKGTDLPLSEKFLGRSVGAFLKQEKMIPCVIYTAPLKRTTKTAELIVKAMGVDVKTILEDGFTEVDYGKDEGKSELDIIDRIGEKALNDWNKKGIVPHGWKFDSDQIKKMWVKFAKDVEEKYPGKIVLLVSSQGVIKYSSVLTGDFEDFADNHPTNVRVGSISVFEKSATDKNWNCKSYNFRPFSP